MSEVESNASLTETSFVNKDSLERKELVSRSLAFYLFTKKECILMALPNSNSGKQSGAHAYPHLNRLVKMNFSKIFHIRIHSDPQQR